MKEQNANIPPVAMVHVDLDNLWAVAECYGQPLKNTTNPDFLYTQAMPALLELFHEAQLKATFFAVGKDLQSPENVKHLRRALDAGHCVASHSWRHRLNWRNLSEQQIEKDIAQTEDIFRQTLGITPQGFRTPGYAFTGTTQKLLARRNYLYDSSLMPSPWGWVFRAMDKSMTGNNTTPEKTQFPLLGDAIRCGKPHQPLKGESPLWELPVAVSPILRLPVQVGVCMKLGMTWQKLHMHATRKLDRPYVMLLHLTDVADFRSLDEDFFKKQSYFAQPGIDKQTFVRQSLNLLKRVYSQHTTTEALLSQLIPEE